MKNTCWLCRLPLNFKVFFLTGHMTRSFRGFIYAVVTHYTCTNIYVTVICVQHSCCRRLLIQARQQLSEIDGRHLNASDSCARTRDETQEKHQLAKTKWMCSNINQFSPFHASAIYAVAICLSVCVSTRLYKLQTANQTFFTVCQTHHSPSTGTINTCDWLCLGNVSGYLHRYCGTLIGIICNLSNCVTASDLE